jgi:hypothetical protein
MKRGITLGASVVVVTALLTPAVLAQDSSLVLTHAQSRLDRRNTGFRGSCGQDGSAAEDRRLPNMKELWWAVLGQSKLRYSLLSNA